MREYAGLHPTEVAGMVLVDSAQEEELLRAPKFYLGHIAPRWLWHPIDSALWAAAQLGVVRLTQGSPLETRNESQMTTEELIAGLRQQPKSFAASASTGVVEPESYAQSAAVRDLGNRPLIVLTAGQPEDFGDPELNRQAAAFQQVWIHELQVKLAHLSTRGRQIVVENSDHDIPSRASDAVIEAIREVVAEVRTETSGR